MTLETGGVRFGFYWIFFKQLAVKKKPNCSRWEGYVQRKHVPIVVEDEIEVEIQTGTNWDVKELVFRDPGQLHDETHIIAIACSYVGKSSSAFFLASFL